MTISSHSTKQRDSATAIVAMVLGTLSVTGFGLLLGIPAIILASISLKNKAAGRELSIAGLITGIVGTVLSLFFFAFVIIMIIWANDQPSNVQPYRPTEQMFDSART